MTLIVGCISEDFGIISGDTQLSIGDLERGTSFRRESQIKIHRPSANLMYGIMGKWSHYIPIEGQPGKVSIINHYDLMRRGVNREDNKSTYIKRFLRDKTGIDATVLIIEKSSNNIFSIDDCSNLPNNDLSELRIGNLTFKFNEPFSSINGNYISSIINEFYDSNELTCSVLDVLFLINNIQLKVISQGQNFNMVDENNVTQVVSTNSVGGVVNLSLITDQNNSWNNLGNPYSQDMNTLLDRTTYPFSNYVYYHKAIRYIDNLSMLIRNIYEPFNNNIRETLIELVEKQITFIGEENIVSREYMNEIISHINIKYTLDISTIEANENEQDENEINIENLVLDGIQDTVDLNYLLRFF